MTFVDDLAAANPVRDETPYGDARAATLIADITAGRVTAPPPPPAPTRRPWLVGGIAVAAAATLAGVLIIPPVLRHDAQVSPGLPVPASASATPTAASLSPSTKAADLLKAAASAAERSPDAKPTAAMRYWRTEVIDVGRGGVSSIEADGVHRQAVFQTTWVQTLYRPVDPTKPSHERQDRQPVRFLSGDSAVRTPAPEVVHITMPPEGAAPGGWLNPTSAWIAALPRTEHALKSRLYADAGGSGSLADGAAFQYAANALWWNRLPTDVQVPLLRVLAAIPGAGIVDGPVTLGERTGWAVTVTTVKTPERRDLVVDPATGRILGLVQVSTEARGDEPAGTRTGSRQFVSRALVDAVPEELRAEPVAPSAPSSPLPPPSASAGPAPSRN